MKKPPPAHAGGGHGGHTTPISWCSSTAAPQRVQAGLRAPTSAPEQTSGLAVMQHRHRSAPRP